MSSYSIEEEQVASNGAGTNIFHVGSREADIMVVLWEQNGKGTVREVYEVLRKKHTIAYTTVMTIMNNLTKKNLLHQDKSRTAYVYTTVKPQPLALREAIDTVVKKIGGNNTSAIESALMQALRDLRAS